MNDLHSRRGSRLLVALAALATIGLAACSSGTSSGGGVASLPGHGSGNGAGTAQLTQAQSDQDMVNFASCLRAHGVNEPDPFHRPGHAGLSVDIPENTPANQHALSICIHLIQPIMQMKNAHLQVVMAQYLPALTRYAQCMRAHDIALLDPTPQGQVSMGNVPGINNGFGRYSPQFHAADAACRHFLPPAIPDDGTGP